MNNELRLRRGADTLSTTRPNIDTMPQEHSDGKTPKRRTLLTSFGIGLTGIAVLPIGGRAARTGVQQQEPGDTRSEAMPIEPGEEVHATIGPCCIPFVADEDDWYRFDATAGDDIRVDFTESPPAIARLVGPSGSILDIDDHLPRRLTGTATQSGTGYVHVTDPPGGANSSYSFVLQVHPDDPPADDPPDEEFAHVVTLTETDDRARRLAWDPWGDRVVYTANDGILYVHEVGGGWPLVDTVGHDDHLIDLAYSTDGSQVAVTGRDGTVLILGTNPYRTEASFTPAFDDGAAATAVAWTGDGSRLAVGSDTGEVTVYDPADWTALRALDHRDAAGEHGCLQVAYSPDDAHFAATLFGGKTVVYDTADWSQPAAVFDDGANDHRGTAWHPDGRYLAYGGGDDRLWIRRVDGWESVGTSPLTAASDSVWRPAFSPDGGHVAYPQHADGACHVHRVGGGWPHVATLTAAQRTAEDASWHPHGNWLGYASRDGTVRIHSAP